VIVVEKKHVLACWYEVLGNPLRMWVRTLAKVSYVFFRFFWT